MHLLIAITTLSILVGPSCSPKKNVPLVPELSNAGEYFSELSRWQKKSKIYSDLQIRCYIEIVYRAEPLIRSYTKRYAELYGLNLDEQAKMLEEELAEATRVDEFIVSIFAPQASWAELSSSDDVWKLRALPGDVKPESVLEISPDDPKVAYFYPSRHAWARHYRVRVPAQGEGGEIAFSMQGVIGSETFTWRKN